LPLLAVKFKFFKLKVVASLLFSHLNEAFFFKNRKIIILKV